MDCIVKIHFDIISNVSELRNLKFSSSFLESDAAVELFNAHLASQPTSFNFGGYKTTELEGLLLQQNMKLGHESVVRVIYIANLTKLMKCEVVMKTLRNTYYGFIYTKHDLCMYASWTFWVS